MQIQNSASTFKHILKRNKIIIVLGSIFLLVVTFFIFYYLLDKKHDESVRYRIDVKGKVISIQDKKPIQGVVIKASNQKIVTDENGLFILNDVYNNDILIINGKDFYENLEIPINSRSEIIIQVDSKLFNLFRNLEKYEKYRKFRDIYNILSSKIKKEYSAEKYLELKNSQRDNLIDDSGYIDFELEISRDIRVVSDDRIETDFVYKFKNSENKIKSIKESIQFVFENDGWYLDNDLLDVFEK